MATQLELRTARRAAGTRHAAGLSRLFRGVSGRIFSAWEQYRLERERAGMPYDLRKDIGFRS